jgi:hypothetical protein
MSSAVSAREIPAGASFPSISTSGGFPGEKNRSLILVEVRNMEASSTGVETGAGAAVAAVAVTEGEGTAGLGTVGAATALTGDDMKMAVLNVNDALLVIGY